MARAALLVSGVYGDADAVAATAASHAAYAAVRAADAAVFAAYASDYAADAAYAAADAADAAERVGGPVAGSFLVEAIVEDFRALSVAAKQGVWTDDTPVNPDPDGPLGPLWPVPTGEPEWKALAAAWKPEQAKATPTTTEEVVPQLALEITTGDATPQMIADYLGSLSDLFHACGGVSLRFKRSGSKIYVVPGVGVPV